MNTRQRQDAIIRSLRRSGLLTVAELATKVGASRRTVLRDINALRDEGFIINSDPGRGGGLQLDPRSIQTTVRLSVTEVFSLLISVLVMRALGNLPFSGFADSGLEKLEKALPPEKTRDFRRFLDCVYVGQLAAAVDISNLGSVDTDLMSSFETAFLQRFFLRFRYCDATGAETLREVEPQAILILPPLWYLVAWDPERNAFRHFRMDRIRQPEVLADKTFRRRHVSFDEGILPYRDLSR